MNKIKIVGETEKTVTLRRSDFHALLHAAEDKADVAAPAGHRAEEEQLGWDVARRNYLTREEAERILEGENRIRVWRGKRGITQRALAQAAKVAVSYLAEIESGKKPGSHDALQRIAQVLEISIEQLGGSPAPSLAPMSRSATAMARLARLAEEGADRPRLANEARMIVRDWIEIAEQEGVRNQVKAAVGALETNAGNIAGAWAESSREKAKRHELIDANRLLAASNALRGAVDALHSEYRKL